MRELLRDAFTRLIEHVDDLTDDLTDEVSFFRPTATANSIAWLIWHSARQQDLQLCNIAGVEQVWTRDGWDDRFGLDLEGNDHGYGHGADDVGKVRVPADLLAGYYHGVHKVTLEYIASVTAEELGRVVDTHWTPPVLPARGWSASSTTRHSTSGRPPTFAASPRDVTGSQPQALLLWPGIALLAMIVLGWAVGKGSTPLDDWFHQFRRTPARWLLFFTDPWVLAVALMFGIAVALYLGRRRLAAVMAIAPLVGIVLAQVLKALFARRSGGDLAYPSGHTTTVVIVMGMLVLLAGGAMWAVLVGGHVQRARSDRSGRDVPLLHRHRRGVAAWQCRGVRGGPGRPNLTGVNPGATQITPMVNIAA